MNLGGETALSIARQLLAAPRQPADRIAKLREIERYLLSRGARMPVVRDRINCTGANHEPFGFEKIRRIVEKCGIRKLDDLIPLFPVTHLSNYVLSYASRGIQKASPTHPRVSTAMPRMADSRRWR